MGTAQSRRTEIKRSMMRRVFNYAAQFDAGNLVAEFSKRLKALERMERGAVQALHVFMKAIEAPPLADDMEAFHAFQRENAGQPRAVLALNVIAARTGSNQRWRETTFRDFDC